MSKQHRKRYSPVFKAKVTLAALREEATTAQLAQRYSIHPSMICTWKKTLLAKATELFESGRQGGKQVEQQVDELYCQIGQLKVERDFLAKGLSRLK